MALLRRSFKVWTRSLRLFGTEAYSMSVEPKKWLNSSGRMASIGVLKRNDFIINRRLAEKKVFEESDYVAAREDLLKSKDFGITEDMVDMIIVRLCLEQNSIDTAVAYLEYLWKTQSDMNLSTMSQYLKLCSIRENGELNEKRMEYLLRIYDTVRTKYPVMDGSTSECCILGISQTHRWKEAFQLCDMVKLTCNPRASTYSAIISAAFRNDEPEIGWQYLKEAFNRLRPEHYVYTTYLEYCTRNFKGEELEKEIGKMLSFWSEYDFRAFVDVAEAYGQVFKALGWRIERTSIRDVGICRNCSHRLSNFKISVEEFSKLAHLMRERAIVGCDVYRKSTPKELKYFLQFVEKRKPWEIVIDGLNVSFLSKTTRKVAGHLVKSTVKLCTEQMGKKVLVLGRKHMKSWPKLDFSYIEQKADIFFAENGSADDPYLLYATLCSGPSAMFISRDLMRQHVNLLEDPEMRRIFKKWQMTHQFIPVAITSKQGTIEIKLENPPRYLPVVQEDTNGWHVPFTFDAALIPPVDYEPPKSWLCFRKTNNIMEF